MVNYKTSTDVNHWHTWNPKEMRTSFDEGHSHAINLNKKLAVANGTGHNHKLLKQKV